MIGQGFEFTVFLREKEHLLYFARTKNAKHQDWFTIHLNTQLPGQHNAVLTSLAKLVQRRSVAV